MSARPLLSAKWTLSAFNWQAYMRQQVRYDLILTNAFIYADDLRAHSELKRTQSDGRTMWHLCATPARTSLEGYGAYLTYQTKSSKNNAEAPRLTRSKQLQAHIYAALLSLIWPLRVNIDFEHKPSQSHSKTIAKNSNNFFVAKTPSALNAVKKKICCKPEWQTYWRERLRYLRALSSIHRGEKTKLSGSAHGRTSSIDSQCANANKDKA